MKVNGVGARLAITLIAVLMFISIIFIPRSQGQEEASEAPPALDKTETIIVKVEFSAPQITAVREYHRVGMEGLANFGKPGEPELPIRPVRVLIPFGSEVVGVRVSNGREVALDGFYIVEPAQKPVPLSSEAPVEFTPPDERIYNCPSPFPERIYSDPFPQSKRGYKILILSLYPVSYVPSKGELSYFEEMTVEVEFRPAPPRGLSVKCSNEDRREIMRMVDNPEAIDSYPLEFGPLGGESEHEYVIITSENLKNYSGDYDWQTLCDRKESRGVTTEIVSLEWIYSNYGGRDNQEKIRNFITDAYENGGTLENWGTKYVLLGGDDTVIPPRFFWVDTGEETEDIPSDMYYSCLDGTFNYDNDDKWGEPNDGENENEVDLYAEVYVGRAPVASGVDVSNFVRKTLAFEDFVPEVKYLAGVKYLAYMVGEWLGGGGPLEYAKESKEEVRLGSDNHGYTTVGFIAADNWVETSTLYEKDGSWSKYDLIDIINNGVWALNHFAHTSADKVMKLHKSDLDSLTNTEYFFAYSQGCNAGHFDGTECWAEKVVRMNNGAAAVVMNARKGLGFCYSTNGPSQHFDREFWDAVFGENIHAMGWANSDSKEDQEWYITSHWYGRWCAYELNLFGDPELHFVNLPPVAVVISPGENIGLPSSTLDYNVLVWNGNREDNYTLTTSDIEDWDLTLSENLLENMQPYETREVTLSVTIPESAVDTEDVTTVTVTSKENSQISDNASCVARVPPERRVEVSVMPKENYGFPSWHVKCYVTVKNTGIKNDNYELTVQDNTWPTSLSENLFTNMESIYGNGDAGTTILTVTIPENAELGTKDSIIVIATSQENENVSDNTSFAVYCGIHEIIYIRGNENFTENNGVTGGSGTENDPYIIENWAISAESAHGIHVKNTTAHFIIQNCLVENGGSGYIYGIYLDNVVNGRIQNNTCENNNCGIRLFFSSNNTLSNNTCKNNNCGIFPYYSDNNTLGNNTCKNNNYGIFLGYSDNNTLTNNTYENNHYGIRLFFSSNNTLDNNTCENNSQDGIDLCDSDNNSLTNNTCKNNNYGIYLLSSSNITLTNNTCENNNYGIYLYGSDSNRIYHNNLINNYNQAYDSGSNYWDDGYPSGGNYWSDYTGVDENQGENQDIPGSDGIGDTLYPILGDNNRDRYPLMNPIRSVEVSISPENKVAETEETLTYDIIVTNTGQVQYNYELTVTDSAGWNPTLSENLLENVGPGENRMAALTVTVPGGELPNVEDNITVTAVSRAVPTVMDSDTCIAVFLPKVEFSLVTLYKVGLNVDNLWLENGSKLVVKFYNYAGGYQSENVVWSGATPDNVSFSKIVPHPENKAVERAELVLTDAEGITISTLRTFIVRKLDLEIRFTKIPLEWFLAQTPEERLALEIEFIIDIPYEWTLAPSSVGPLALGFLISEPGGTTIEVMQGDNFLIRHTLEWNEPENGGYAVTIAWDCYDNHENENFTFLGAEAYFDLDNDNLPDPGLDPILAVVKLDSAPSPDYPGSTRYALSVSCPANNKDNRDGRFNVDITLSASGVGGVPHIPGDHVIPWHFAGFGIVEKYPESWYRDAITIKVLGRSVSVSISPSYDGAQYGENITFSVMVTNTGDDNDNFALTVDNQWTAVLSDNKTSQLSPWESENFTLTVTVPASAKRGDNDKITVTATSQSDNTVSDNYYCTAVCGWLQYDAHGEKTAYNIDLECQEPWRYYPKGSLPPIMATKKIGRKGRVVAAGFASTCADNQWSENENFHVLMDNIFNWLVRGYRTTNNDVLWYTGHGVHYDNERCSQLIDNLKALGWNITADNFEPITTGELENYDIVVIPQLREGDTCTGGDPTQLLDSEVDNLYSFVKGADKRGLLVLESSDYGGYNYNRVQNKILVRFSFPVYFQNDEVVDYTSNWGSHYKPIVWVYDTGYNSIGDYYQAATGDNEVGLYRVCSLAESADNGA